MTRGECLALLDRDAVDLPLTLQVELLSLNRSGLYYKPVAPTAEELALKKRIDEIYTKCPFYGSRKIAAQLQRDGQLVNRKAVQRHMREMGIEGVRPGPNLSKRNLENQIYPYLLRNLAIITPNQVWGTDITYIRLANGWLYLVAFMDWHSRYVVSWALEQSLEIAFVLSALGRGLEQAKPGIINSDQGSHFTSRQYISVLQVAGIQISMDGRGRALDNIFTERLWRSLKYEEVYLKEYGSPREAREGIARYMTFYNNERIHQHLGYKTPAEVYFGGDRLY